MLILVFDELISNEWYAGDFDEYCLFGNYMYAFSTYYKKWRHSHDLLINTKLILKHIIITLQQQDGKKSIIRPCLSGSDISVLVYLRYSSSLSPSILAYMRVSCTAYFIWLKPKNLLLIRRLSFRSVIKTKKEYGHRGKESIHSFRKTMHVRDHQPLLQQHISYEHERWTFFRANNNKIWA